MSCIVNGTYYPVDYYNDNSDHYSFKKTRNRPVWIITGERLTTYNSKIYDILYHLGDYIDISNICIPLKIWNDFIILRNTNNIFNIPSYINQRRDIRKNCIKCLQFININFNIYRNGKDHQPVVYIFYGESGLGQEHIAKSIKSVSKYSVFFTDKKKREKLPDYIDSDIIVLGNKYNFTLHDITSKCHIDSTIVYVYFEKDTEYPEQDNIDKKQVLLKQITEEIPFRHHANHEYDDVKNSFYRTAKPQSC